MSSISWDAPIAAVLGSQGKDKKKAEAFSTKMGLRTVGDLLWHFPRTYLPTGEVSKIDHLVEGQCRAPHRVGGGHSRARTQADVVR